MRTIIFGPATYNQFSREFEHYVNTGDWVLDIGSNIGCATAPLSDMVGSDGKVICFEANPYFVEEAKVNLQSRNNIDFNDYACGYEYGTLDYYYFFDNGQIVDYVRDVHVWLVPYFINDKKSKLVVNSVDTNDFLFKKYGNDLRKIKFIKVDTEGYDAHILKNLKPLIDMTRPIIQIEWFVHNTFEMTQFMVDTIEYLNYDAYKVNEDQSITKLDLVGYLKSVGKNYKRVAEDLILKPR